MTPRTFIPPEYPCIQSASPYVDRLSGAGADYQYVVRYRGTKADEIGGESLPAIVAARGETSIAA